MLSTRGEPARTNGLPPFPGMAFAAFRANASNATLLSSPSHLCSHFSSGALERERDFSRTFSPCTHAWYRFQRVSFLSLMNVRPSLTHRDFHSDVECCNKRRGSIAATRITNTSLMSDSAFSSCWTAFRDQFRDFGPSLSLPSSILFYSTYLSQNFGNSRTADTCRPYRPEDRPRAQTGPSLLV